MSIRGPQALASLEDAMRDIRREEDEIAKKLARSAERATKIRETEAELLRQLARLRLDPKVAPELDGRISAAESKARDMLKAHGLALGKTEADLQAADGRLAELMGQRSTLLAAVEDGQRQLDALAARLGADLARNPDLARKTEDAKDLAAIAEEARHKTEQAEADREGKGAPYRNDPLFSYLWERGYGTSAYRAGGVIRLLDDWVARLTRFHQARPNFAMLNDIPARLREHAEQQAAAAADAEDALHEARDAAIDAGGGAPIRKDLEATEQRIAALDENIVAAEDTRDDMAERFSALAQGKDPDFEGALGSLVAELGREDIQALLAEARLTRTGQDDTIVAQIDDARTRIREEDGEAREHNARLKVLAARRRELEDIQWEFKKQGFDNPSSSFREDRLTGDLLNDFLRGGISAANYWEHWRRSQNWNPGPSPSSGGGFSWPDSSFGGGQARSNRRTGGFGGGWGGSTGGSGGGGFSRPRTGSSGTRRHGGFKTGGGF